MRTAAATASTAPQPARRRAAGLLLSPRRLLDALSRRLRPRVHLLGRSFPAYGTGVCVGVVLGVAAVTVLGHRLGLSSSRTAAAAGAAIVASLALAFASRAAIGRERYVFFHYQFLSLAAAGAVLALWPGPVLAHLDLLALALGLADASGRIGCLNTGCCHGRPAPWGIRYSHAHAAAGFPAELVGVRLWPVQPLETLGVGAVVAVGAAMLLAGGPPGTALAVYLLGYSGCRFLLEMLRGDADRPHRAGLSEGQWTSLATIAATAAAGAAGWLPLGGGGVVAAGALLAALGALCWREWRRAEAVRHLLSPRHTLELALLVAQPATAAGTPIRVGETSGGLRLSHGRLGTGPRAPAHYCLSHAGGLSQRAVRAVASRIALLAGIEAPWRLVPGGPGVFHLLVGGDLAEPAPAGAED